MKSKKVIVAVIICAGALIAAILGCSDKTFTSSTSEISTGASPTVYIPLEEGWRVSYVVLEPESQQFDIEVTDPAIIAGNPGYTVRRTDRTTGQSTVTYRYAKDNAIFESKSVTDPGVRILESPFVIGNSWDRYNTVTISTGDGDGTLDDGTGGGGKEEEGSLKTIPDDDYSTMSIVAIESVEALNGVRYGNCLKVAWQTGESTVQYYWYAPGIGLVKFEQNVDLLNASSNRTLGLMTDYQLVEY